MISFKESVVLGQVEIVDGMNVRDSRVHNYPPRWNAAPSQELLVIRHNHQTGEVSSIHRAGARALAVR
jgi:hypothetical protein